LEEPIDHQDQARIKETKHQETRTMSEPMDDD